MLVKIDIERLIEEQELLSKERHSKRLGRPSKKAKETFRRKPYYMEHKGESEDGNNKN